MNNEKDGRISGMDMPLELGHHRPMTSDCIAACEAFIRAINGHSIDELRALMSDDHVFVDPQDRAVSGRDAMVGAWAAYFGMFPDFRIEADTMITHGGTVAIFGHASGTFNGKRGPVPEARIAMPAAWRATVSEGKIKVWQVYADWSEGMKVIERESKNG
jgi:ketosteroid isomerase-like protein